MSMFNTTNRRNLLQTSTMLTGALLVMAMADQAQANPTGGNVVGGQANIANSGLHTEITQSTNRALIEWSSFNINQNESVNFAQPNSSSIALNRVVGSQAPSTIAGKLTANGNVIISNSNGVMFTGTADVNVGGMVATTADIDNKKFMSGNLTFDKAGNAGATISNAGNVKAGGVALFVGPNVTNSGLIEAKTVQLASGDTFAVDLYGDGLLSLQASGDLTKQLVENSGKISANGGNVLLTAATAQNAIESVINMDGLIQADSVANKGGKVVLVSSKNNGTTLVSGKIKAAGGNVDVLGGNVGILTGAEINVSGDTAGKIRIGGDFHGAGDTLTANNTIIQSGANLFANALLNGTGGDVAVWADHYTLFDGNIEAKGANGAKGGFVETSGKNILEAYGTVTADTWLLDPNDITISGAADANVTGNPNFTTTANSGVVSVGSIQTNLNAGTSVVITTGDAGSPHNQSGNITVANSISKTAGADATLTLNALNNIVVNNGVTIGSTAGKLGVSLLSDSDAANGGSITMNGTINSNGGNVVLAGGTGGTGYASGGSTAGTAYGVSITGSINAAGGDITIRGQGRLSNTDNNVGVVFVNGNPTLQTTGNGAISVNGIGGGNGGNSNNNYGIQFINTTSTLSTQNGAISLNGTGGGTSSSNGNNNDGIHIENGTTNFTSTGTGSISFTGTGGGNGNSASNNNGINFYNNTSNITTASGAINLTGAGGGINNANSDANNGIRFENGQRTINSTSGAITLTGTQGGDKIDTNYGMYSLNTTTNIGNVADIGNIAFFLDRMLFTNGSFTAKTTQRINIETVTAPTTIGVNGGAGTLNLTSTFLDSLTAGKIVIGGANGDGAITANARTWQAPVSFRTKSGAININGVQAMAANLFSAISSNGGTITIGASGGVSSSATGDAIVLATSAGNFINNNLSNPFTISAGAGRWLVYSTAPASNTLNGLASDFFRYSCTYGGACPAFPSTGNGLLYSTTPILTLTVTPDPKTTTYGQAAPTLTYTLVGYQGSDATSDTVTGSASLTTTYVIGNSIGNYDIIATPGTLTSSLGYGFAGSTLAGGLSVTKAALTINVTNQNVTYGNAMTLGNGFTTSGLYGAETVGGVTYGTTDTFSTGGHYNAGSYTLSASGATGGTFNPNNYTISYVSGTLNVAKRDLAITSVTAGNKVYDGNNTAVNVNLWSDNRASGDTSLSYGWSSTTFDNKNVGNGKTVTVNGLYVTGTDAANYNLNTNVTTTANITPASLSIKANDQSFTYGSTTTLGNGIVATGLVGGDLIDTVTYSTSDTKSGSNNWKAGSYTLSAANPLGANFDANNYAISYVNGALNIAQRALVIGATANNKTYDATTAATGTVTTDAIVGDNVTTSYTSAAFSDKDVANGKTVTFTGASVGGADLANYSYTIPAPLTALANITPASLTIKANNQSQVYGDGNVLGNGYQITGLQGGETVGNVTLTTNDTNSTSGNWKAGTYNIITSNATGGTFNPNNYDVHYTNGTLTVLKKNLTTTVTGQNKVYDATTAATVTFTDDRITNDVLAETAGNAIFTDKNVGTGKNVFVTGITIGGTDAANYNLINTAAVVTADITQRILHLNAAASNKVYDATNVAFASLTDDHIAGDNVTSSFTNATFSDKNVGVGKVVTLNGVTVTGSDVSNYSYTLPVTTTANITQKALNLIAAASNKVYDATNVAFASLTDDHIVGDDVTSSFTNATFSDKNVGVGKVVTLNGVTVTGVDAANYSYTLPVTTTANITQKALNLIAAASNKVYDATTVAFASLTDDHIAGDNVTSSFTNATFSDKNVANGKTVTLNGVTVTGADAGNYSYTLPVTTTANITPAGLIVGANSKAMTYGDGNTYNGFYSLGLKGSDAISNVDFTTNASTSTSGNWKAGVWTIGLSNPTGANFSAGNYNITYIGGGLLIAQKALSIAAHASDKTYDATTTASVTLTDNHIGSDVIVDHYATANFNNKNVGTNKLVTVTGISFNGADAGNYYLNPLTNFLGLATDHAAITKAALTITANNQGFTYGGATVLGNGFTTSGLQGGETVGSVTYSTNDTKSTSNNWKAGSYNLIASNATGGTFSTSNYAITYVNGTLNIAQKALAVTATGVNKVYDATTNATVTLADNRISGDVFTDSYGSANFSDKNVANGKTVTVNGIAITGTDAANYLPNTTTTTTANITPASLTVTAKNKTMVYGDGNNYNGFTSSGLKGSDSITSVSYSTNDGVSGSGNWNAGNYHITPSNATGANFSAGNYNITYVNGNLQVLKRLLFIGADAANKTYDATTTANVTLSDTRISGDVFNDNYTSANFINKNVGNNKLVTVTGLSISGADAGNYLLVNPIAFDLANITKAALTITAKDQSFTYGDTTVLGNGFTASGLQGGETVGHVTYSTDDTLSGSGNWNAGSYQLFAGNAGGGTFSTSNYTINYVAGSLDIAKAALTITADHQTKVYGDADPAFTYGASGFVGGETAGTILTGGLTRDAGENVAGGPYAINQGTLDAGNNYAINYIGNTLVITPATLHVNADSFAINLGDAIPPFTYQVTGYKFSDDGSILTGALAPISPTSLPGFYDILQGTLSVNSNYVIDYTPGVLEIDSPFAGPNSTERQNSEFNSANFRGKGVGGSLLQIVNNGGGAPQGGAGGLGGLAPAAGGDNPTGNIGDLAPAAGAFSLLDCDDLHPCQAVE